MTNKTLLTLVLTLALFAPTLTGITSTVICYTRTENQNEYREAQLKSSRTIELNDTKVFDIEIYNQSIPPTLVPVSDPRGYRVGCRITLKVISAKGLNIEITEKDQDDPNEFIDMPQDVGIQNNKEEWIDDMPLYATATIAQKYCTAQFLYTNDKWKEFFVNQYTYTEWRQTTNPKYNPPKPNPDNIEQTGLEVLKYMKFPELPSTLTLNTVDDEEKLVNLTAPVACLIVPTIQSEVEQRDIEQMHAQMELESRQRAQDAIDKGEIMERMLIV